MDAGSTYMIPNSCQHFPDISGPMHAKTPVRAGEKKHVNFLVHVLQELNCFLRNFRELASWLVDSHPEF